jgi:prevent-host-death family protein
MEEIGVRDLKRQISAVLRRVKEEKAIITITSHGQPVARLVPVEDDDALWAELDELAQEIGRYWPEGISAAEAVSEQRRQL